MKNKQKKYIKIIKFLLTTILILCLKSVDAQNLIGFRGIYQYATVSCDSVKMKRSIATVSGVGGGLVYKHFELGPIGFQGEINYEEKGFKINNTDSTDYSQKMKYLTLPLMMHVDIGKHAVKAIFALGIYGEYLLEKPSITDNCNGNYAGIERIVNGTCNNFMFGVIGQAGIAVCSKVGVFQLEMRASQGMSKTMDLGDLALMNYIMSRTFGVSLAYMKPFGEKKYYEKKIKPIDDQPLTNNPIIEKADTLTNQKPKTETIDENAIEVESDFDFQEPDNNENNLEKEQNSKKQEKNIQETQEIKSETEQTTETINEKKKNKNKKK